MLIFLCILFLGFFVKQRQYFVPMESTRVPTRSSGTFRASNYSSQLYDLAPKAKSCQEVVYAYDYYRKNQMPTDLGDPYWPQTIWNKPDYAWRL
jgi:hypothetical protein